MRVLRRHRASVVIALAVGTLAAWLLVAGAPALVHAQNGPARVEVDAVRTEPLSQTAPVIGRIVTRRQGPVAARVTGLVGEVTVRVGDRVARGDPLVLLDAEPLKYERELAAAEHEAAVAEREVAEAQLELLRGERERLARLKGSAAFSKAQLVDKDNEIAVARSRIETANARIDQYQATVSLRARDLEDATIRAPYSGVVSTRHVSAGAYLSVGDPVVTLIDDDELELEAEVPSDRLAGLRPGTEAEVTLDDGTEHTAEVRAVVPEEDPLTRTRTVRFEADFAATDKPLAVNQSVTLHLPVGVPRQVVTVDKDGVIQRQNGAMVYVVEDQSAAPRPVRLGEAVGSRLEVLSGLEAGELVVVRGNERLSPGQSITYREDVDGKARGKEAKS